MKYLASLLMGLFVSSAAFGGGSTTAGVPNPAAGLCIEVGGKLLGVQVAAGEASLCRIGDRALIDTWTLFRELSSHDTLAVAALRANQGPRLAMPHPALLYCSEAGGRIEFGRSSENADVALCRFSDNSVIEAWTLWGGASAPENARLLKVLNK